MDPVISAITRTPGFSIGIGERAPSTQPGPSSGAGFGGSLVESLGKLDQLQTGADAQAQALATGQAKDIASVVTEAERAALAMQLAVQVRNRAVESYHELFRMQV